MTPRTDTSSDIPSSGSREDTAADLIILSRDQGQDPQPEEDSSGPEAGQMILVEVKAQGRGVLTFQYNSSEIAKRIIRDRIRRLLKK